MESRRSLSARLLAGLVVMLSAAAVYSAYTAIQIRSLKKIQTGTIDRNRTNSLLLLRIQNDLNSFGLAMRDMLDSSEGYPLTAWQPQFRRLRSDLEDAMARESQTAPSARTAEQAQYMASSVRQFGDALDRVFELAAHDEAEARNHIRNSLQARQDALTTAVSRMLVQNNESEEQAAAETQAIYRGVERNLYIFLGAMLLVIAGTSAYLLQYNRRVFDQVTALSQRRSELAQQLISIQENTFRSISRELHDEFGQILTAVGSLLARAGRKADDSPELLKASLREVQEIVQHTLEKVRALSQALHPVILDEVGLESALDTYLPVFEKRTGITIGYEKSGECPAVNREQSIHIYRVLQESLNNVARHAKATEATVRLKLSPSAVVLEVEDSGVGFNNRRSDGMGLVSMRERAEMIGGEIEFLEGAGGGALVRLTVPLSHEEAHAGFSAAG